MKTAIHRTKDNEGGRAAERIGLLGRIGQVILPVCMFAFLLFPCAMHLFRIGDRTQLTGVKLAPMPEITVRGG